MEVGKQRNVSRGIFQYRQERCGRRFCRIYNTYINGNVAYENRTLSSEALYNGNGIVYHVTSLEDDSLKVGTLRYGLVNPEMIGKPRTIVFDVSGAIKLTKRLNSSDPYVTIAGQTAPGIGVLVRDQPFGANSDEGVTRFMRFRYGHGDDWDETSANQNVGNAAGLSGNYAIMDHCLLGWGSDETFSSRGAKNITFQNDTHSVLSIGCAAPPTGIHDNTNPSTIGMKHTAMVGRRRPQRVDILSVICANGISIIPSKTLPSANKMGKMAGDIKQTPTAIA